MDNSNHMLFFERAKLYIKVKSFDLAINDIDVLLKNKYKVPESIIMKIECLMCLKKYEDAENIVKSDFMANNVEKEDIIFQMLGNIYRKQKKFKEALNQYSKMKILDNLITEQKAFCYLQIEDYSNAVSEYSKIIEKENKNCTLLLNRGLCFARMKKYPKAISDFKEILQINPNHVEAQKFLVKAENQESKESVNLSKFRKRK